MTCWLEQDLLYAGQPQHVSAPMTIVLRKIDSDWRVAVIHAVPLQTKVDRGNDDDAHQLTRPESEARRHTCRVRPEDGTKLVERL